MKLLLDINAWQRFVAAKPNVANEIKAYAVNFSQTHQQEYLAGLQLLMPSVPKVVWSFGTDPEKVENFALMLGQLLAVEAKTTPVSQTRPLAEA